MRRPEAEAGARPRRARWPALLAALLLGAGAFTVGSLEALPEAPFLTAWEREHADPRPVAEADAAWLRNVRARARRDDATALLAALAVGCLALAWRPRALQRLGDDAAAALVAGSVLLGAWSAGRSALGLAEAARRGEWTLADDALGALAGPHAGTLRAWRERVPETDAVLLVGTDPALWSQVAWALHPRPLFPLLRDVPASLTESELRAAVATHPAVTARGCRWLVDLGALDAGGRAAHPPLIEIGR